VRLVLVLVVDVADEHVVPRFEVERHALRLADGELLDLVDQLDPFTGLVHRARLLRRQRFRCQVGLEDDELVSEVVVPGLRSNGFDVVRARDAAGALEAMQKQAIDVVLSDIVMPGRGDGFYLADEIRRSYPEVPIVLATGYSDALTASSPFRVLLKPYTINEAIAALQHELRRFKGRAPAARGRHQ